MLLAGLSAVQKGKGGILLKATITFTGDILCSPGLTEAAAAKYGRRDYSFAFAEIRHELARGDLLVGNLETPIAGGDLLFTHERYCFNTPEEFAVMLKEYGFGLVCLANNHCMDRGEAGIIRTLDNLDRTGLAHTGLYRDESERRPTVIDLGGIRIGIVNYTYGTNAFAHHTFLKERPSPMVNLFQPEETLPGSIHLLESEETIAERTAAYYGRSGEVCDEHIRPYLARLEKDMAETKAASDFVIAVMHSGGQYNPLPDAYTRMVARTLRKYGADCIVGHHPHVIHPALFEEGIFTAYSLGNLYCIPSDAHDPVGASYSALLTLTVEKNEGKAFLAGAEFSVTATLMNDALPYCVNASSLKDTADAVRYAQLFSGTACRSAEESYTIF